MINSDLFDMFAQDKIDKQAKIEYSGGVMTNTELFQNSEQLTESLCSENELRFGCCEASCFKFKVANIVKPLSGEWIRYSIIVNQKADNPMFIGKYKVLSDKLTSDRKHREIVAYDAMYDIINADVAGWYNSVFPEENSSMTLKQFRESFIQHFGLTEVVPDGGLVNDDMLVKRTIAPEQISGKYVITAICEINGCFGHIGRDGKFNYIYLAQATEGLYPENDLYPDHAPDYLPYQQRTGHLYPQGQQDAKNRIETYIECKYEDFTTKDITKIQIRKKENDIGCIYGSGDNCYIIQDNFLVYGKSSKELENIAKNIYSKISYIIYRPIYSLDIRGNPCFEVGDTIRLNTKYDIIETYILKRALKGVQAMRDNYSANGVKEYAEKVNGVNRSIIQLKGKTNTLERTVDETRLEMKDIEAGLKTDISVTAAGLKADITAEKNRAEGEESKLSNSISVTASGLQAEIARADSAEINLSNRINITSDGLQAEITRASGAENTLSARVDVNAQQISLRMTDGDVRSIIEQTASSVRVQAEKISWSSVYSNMTEDGRLWCMNAEITGTLRTGYYGQGYWLYLDSSGKINGGLGTRQYGYIDFSADLINPEHPGDPNYRYYGIQIQGGILRISAPIISVGRSTNINELTYEGGNGTIEVGGKTIRFINGIMVTNL